MKKTYEDEHLIRYENETQMRVEYKNGGVITTLKDPKLIHWSDCECEICVDGTSE